MLSKKDRKNKQVFMRMFKMLDKKDLWKAVLASILIALSVAADLLNPFITQKVIANLQEISATSTSNGIDPHLVEWYWFGIMFALAVVSIILQILSMLLTMSNATKLTSKLRYNIFSHTRYLPSQDVDKIGSSSILTRVTSDVSQTEQFFINYNTLAVKAIFMSIGAFILSIYQLADYVSTGGNSDVWYAMLAYIFIFIFLIIAGCLMKKTLPYFNESRKAVDKNNEMMSENIVGYKTIRTLNLDKIEEDRYNVGNKNLRNILIKSEKIIAILVPTTFVFLNMSLVAIYAFGGVYSWFADISTALQTVQIVSVIMAFGQYITMVLLGLVLFSSFGYTITRAKVSGKRILELLDIQSSIKEIENPLDVENGDIEFKHVCFKYEDKLNKNIDSDNKTYTINDISFKIKSGQTLGIIGETGSGKTTLVKLLTRLYDVDKGEVLVSNTNVKKLSLKSLRNNISVSLQEKVLLKGTFKSNIKIGKIDASDEEVIEAAKNAQAWEFICKKDGQLEGVVEERGSNLSGGQKQRVSIARSLIKPAKILVFDDSTSALDTITESKILDALKNKFKGITKIMISQKVKSIQDCDNIIVLENGRIKQQGTHKELLKDKNGAYYKIYDSQKTSIEG